MPYVPFDGQLDSSSGTTGKAGRYVPFVGELDDRSSEEPSSLRRVGDVGVSLAKGAVAVPEAAVGLADILSGGRAGKLAEEAGFRPREARQFLDEYLSPQQKEANQNVAEAKGFANTVGAALENPSTILQAGVESVPSMLAGGLIAKTLKYGAPLVRAAAGEGIVGAGIAAEQTRQQTDDGMLSAGQSGAALASGVGTGIFGLVGGRIAQRLGISDVDTLLAGGGRGLTSKGIARRIVEGGISEGVFEELPQSIQEQVWQNAALDKPLLEGVPESAAMGLLTGAAIGAVGGSFARSPQESKSEEPKGKLLALENKPDPYIVFPDGSVGKRAEVENYINNLPENEQIPARAKLLGLGEQKIEDIAKASNVDDAIRAFEGSLKSTYADADAIESITQSAEQGALEKLEEPSPTILTPEQMAQQDRIADTLFASNQAPSGELIVPQASQPSAGLYTGGGSFIDAQIEAIRKRDAGQLLTAEEAALARLPLDVPGANPNVEVPPQYKQKQPFAAPQVTTSDPDFNVEPTNEIGANAALSVPIKATAAPVQERRQNVERRKLVAQMSPEEMRQALLTDELTGLGNRRAYNETVKKPYQASIDIDSLKWVNDNLGHDAGDKLIQALGQALKEEGVDGYHLSGDEFAAQFDDEIAGAEAMRRVQDKLKNAVITAVTPDGTVITKKGVEFSHGIAKTIEDADGKLRGDKAAREASGQRAARGAEPSGVVRKPATRNENNGRDAAAEEVTKPLFSKPEKQTGLSTSELTTAIARLRAKWVGVTNINIVQSINDLPELLSKRVDGDVEGFYDPSSKSVYLIADNIESPARAAWVAAHEVIGHGGLRMLKDQSVDQAVKLAGTNRFIKQLAKAISDERGDLPQNIATEEAIAELAAAISEDDFQALVDRYGIDIPMSAMSGVKGVVGRVVEALRRFMASITGRQVAEVSDAEVRSLISAMRSAVEGVGTDRPTVAQSDKALASKSKPSQLPEFIEIDGKRRPTANSNGQPIAQNEEAIRNFYKWFADSKIIDDQGRPLVVYHSTLDQDKTQFDKRGRFMGYTGVSGISVTDSPEMASRYLDRFGEYGWADGKPNQPFSKNVMPLYVRAENPLLRDEPFKTDLPLGAPLPENYVSEAERQGYDALIRNDAVSRKGPVKHSTAKNAIRGREIVVFSPEQIKSATGNKGTFDPDNPSILKSKAPDTWMSPTSTKMDDIIYTMQDKQIDTKRVVDAVRKKMGEFEDRWDPYLQEELFHGRSAKQVKDFVNKELSPLLQEMKARGIGMEEFEEFLHMRHAEERNQQIAKVNPKMPDGGSGVKTAEARKYLSDLSSKKRSAYEALAKRIDAINANTRKLLVDSGLETPETVAAWGSAYKNYVPLNREETTSGIGQGFSVRGTASKRAMGSDKAVVDILANIAMQRERTIVRTEKNRVAKALYGLALQSPNKDFWLPVNPDNPKKNTVADLENMGLSAEDAENLVKEPKQRYIDPRTGLVAERVNPLLRSAENVLAVRVAGQDRFLFFKDDNERAMRMASALKNLDADSLGRVLSISASVSRYFAAINTQYNPVFGGINLLRDTQGALINLSTTPLQGKQKEVLANTVSALRGIYIDVRDQRKGKEPSSSWAKLYDEFQKEGGQTGFRNMFVNSKARAEDIQRELNPDAWMDSKFGKIFTINGNLKVPLSTAMKTARPVFDWLSDYNETMENAVRLAAYKVAKDSGMTKDRAASLAKNLTVNFNRKGQITTQAGALYAFFNANVQGTARLAETLAGPLGKKIIKGGLLLGAMQAVMLAAAGYDDEPEEFVKSRNIVIPLPGSDGKYLTIPMPLGFNVIPSISRISTEFVLSGFKDPFKRFAEMFDLFLDAFNPIGNAGLSLQTIAPTAVDPLAAIAENKDWTGKPIAKPDMNALSPTPGHLRAKDTASATAKALSYWMNVGSGGTKYKPGLLSPTPDQLDYLIGQLFGGVGREYLKVEQAIASTFSGEDLPTYKTPLLGRFYGDVNEQSNVANRFYDNVIRLNQHEAQIKGLRKEGVSASEYIKDNPESRLIGFANDIEGEVRRLRKTKRELLERNASKERVKLIEQRISAKMKALNERVERLEEKTLD